MGGGETGAYQGNKSGNNTLLFDGCVFSKSTNLPKALVCNILYPVVQFALVICKVLLNIARHIVIACAELIRTFWYGIFRAFQTWKRKTVGSKWIIKQRSIEVHSRSCSSLIVQTVTTGTLPPSFLWTIEPQCAVPSSCHQVIIMNVVTFCTFTYHGTA